MTPGGAAIGGHHRELAAVTAPRQLAARDIDNNTNRLVNVLRHSPLFPPLIVPLCHIMEEYDSSLAAERLFPHGDSWRAANAAARQLAVSTGCPAPCPLLSTANP